MACRGGGCSQFCGVSHLSGTGVERRWEGFASGGGVIAHRAVAFCGVQGGEWSLCGDAPKSGSWSDQALKGEFVFCHTQMFPREPKKLTVFKLNLFVQQKWTKILLDGLNKPVVELQWWEQTKNTLTMDQRRSASQMSLPVYSWIALFLFIFIYCQMFFNVNNS